MFRCTPGRSKLNPVYIFVYWGSKQVSHSHLFSWISDLVEVEPFIWPFILYERGNVFMSIGQRWMGPTCFRKIIHETRVWCFRPERFLALEGKWKPRHKGLDGFDEVDWNYQEITVKTEGLNFTGLWINVSCTKQNTGIWIVKHP